MPEGLPEVPCLPPPRPAVDLFKRQDSEISKGHRSVQGPAFFLVLILVYSLKRKEKEGAQGCADE